MKSRKRRKQYARNDRLLAQSRKKVARKRQLLSFLGVAIVFFGSGLALAFSLPTARFSQNDERLSPALTRQYDVLTHNVQMFDDRQEQLHSELVSDQDLQDLLSNIQLDAVGGHLAESKQVMMSTQASLTNWNLELNVDSAIASTTASVTSAMGAKFLPIVVYHYTPSDFEQQLQYLQQQDYTVIDMATAVRGLEGSPLPPKPVVITFDDGFENQMQAFTLLERYHMKATFYIINGGIASLWCIGAGRRPHDPLHPPGGCGDAYLTWDQVRQLDHSGLITIGGHTLDHEDLTTLSPDQQWHEIDDSKTGIEQEIGHSIHDFAYPYGAYDATTIGMVQRAGYSSAVTTASSDYQSPGSQYTLERIRDTYSLP